MNLMKGNLGIDGLGQAPEAAAAAFLMMKRIEDRTRNEPRERQQFVK
jgi:hypothetical protein